MTTDSPGASLPGTARSSRNASASLPVLRMPSSVSTAACEVTTQPGRGSGPRQSGSTLSQVDHRWPSSSRSSDAWKSKTKEGSRSGSRSRSEGRFVKSYDIAVGAPGSREEVVCGQAKDSRGHVTLLSLGHPAPAGRLDPVWRRRDAQRNPFWPDRTGGG